jgi:uncharacterized membrane protein
VSAEPEPRGGYARGGLEFERLAFFTDAVFAIAMTLLIVAVAVPGLRDESSGHELLHALGDKSPEFLAFFVGFAVLGNYWLAHHRFYGYLARIENGFVALSLLYLAFVAWLPFPTALLGEFGDNALAVSLFALSAGVVSALEAVLLARADRCGLLRRSLSRPVFRHAMRAALLPDVFFLLSIPIAFANTTVAIASWFLTAPGEAALARIKPPGF